MNFLCINAFQGHHFCLNGIFNPNRCSGSSSSILYFSTTSSIIGYLGIRYRFLCHPSSCHRGHMIILLRLLLKSLIIITLGQFHRLCNIESWSRLRVSLPSLFLAWLWRFNLLVYHLISVCQLLSELFQRLLALLLVLDSDRIGIGEDFFWEHWPASRSLKLRLIRLTWLRWCHSLLWRFIRNPIAAFMMAPKLNYLLVAVHWSLKRDAFVEMSITIIMDQGSRQVRLVLLLLEILTVSVVAHLWYDF